MEENRKLQIDRRDLLLLFLFGGLSFLLMICHEPWRDELQAWLVARDLNLLQILQELRNEGHFLLWYLVLKPFAITKEASLLGEISWLLSIAGAIVFLLFSPFRFRTRAAILFSAPFLYWYTALSRCYALIPILLFLAAAGWKHRFRHPFLSMIPVMLLANTHVILEGFVFGVFTVRFAETLKRRKTNPDRFLPELASLGLPGCSVLAAFFQVWPCRSNVPRSSFSEILRNFIPSHASILANYCKDACQLPLKDFGWAAAALLFLTAVFILFFRDCLKRKEGRASVVLSLFCGLCAFLLLIFVPDRHPDVQLLNAVSHSLFAAVFVMTFCQLFRAEKKAGWIFLCGCLMLYGITAALYPYVIAQRAMLFFFLYVFCVWILKDEMPDKSIIPERALCFLSLMLLPGLLFCIKNEFTREYSTVRTAAAFITENVPKEAYIAFWPHDDTTSVLSAFAPEHQFYSLVTGRPETFFRHHGKPANRPPAQLIREQFQEKEGYLIVPVFALNFLQNGYGLEKRLKGEYQITVLCSTLPDPVVGQEQFVIFKLTKLQ